jgi:hypothetical protein
MSRRYVYGLLVALFFSAAAFAQEKNYVLRDQVCAVVGNQPPILRSEIVNFAKVNQLSFKAAQDQLKMRDALFVYAQDKPWLGLADAYQGAESHLKRIMSENHKNVAQFSEILAGSPYYTTIGLFKRNTAYAILKQRFEATQKDQVKVAKYQLDKAVEEYKKAKTQEVKIVFVNVPCVSASSSVCFDMAKKIRNEISTNTHVNHLKIIRNKFNQVSFIGPKEYQRGELKEEYEKVIAKYGAKNTFVSEPFRDGRGVTLIWQLKNSSSDVKLERTTIEKIENQLYVTLLQQKLEAVTNIVLAQALAKNSCQ